MGILSNAFFLFVIVSCLVYYLVPVRARPFILLIASVVYYLSYGWQAALVVCFCVLLTWLCAKLQTDPQETTRNIAFAIGLACCFLMLFYLKIADLPLFFGISYYTFQSTGYLIDVRRGLIEPERNLMRYALFVLFFPQLAQGPIGRYDRLAPQLFTGQPLDFHNLKLGAERIAYGVCKKMLIADWAAVYRAAIFSDPDAYAGIAIFGVLLYTVELYGNFSGGIDVMLGVAQLFGVTLDENFRRPFFATSLSDFWTRWHITLGAWMKDYVFYPLARAKAFSALGAALKKKFPNGRLWRTLPQGICSVVVFMLVGLWHGFDAGNVGWGLYNGIIIAMSTLLAGTYRRMKRALRIDDKSLAWRIVCILRTFAIVNFSWYFTCDAPYGTARQVLRYSVTRFQPSQFLQIAAGRLGTAYTPYALLTIALGACLMFTVSVLQENGSRALEALRKTPLAAQFVFFAALVVAVPLFGPMGVAGGFIYAQF